MFLSTNSTLKRDKIKKEYCLNNNIPLLSIKYNETIDEVLLNWIPTIR